MSQGKYIVIVLLAIIFGSCSIGKSKKNKSLNSKPIDNLIGNKSNFIESTNGKWIEDSIGSNGFRYIASDKIARSYTLKNDDWSKWRNYFGKANGSFKGPNDSVFLYVIYNYDKRPIELQVLYFSIHVSSDGKISHAAISISDF
jgi:hypothetical protein